MNRLYIELMLGILLLAIYGLFLWLGERGAEFAVFLLGSFYVGAWIAKISKAIVDRVMEERA